MLVGPLDGGLALLKATAYTGQQKNKKLRCMCLERNSSLRV